MDNDALQSFEKDLALQGREGSPGQHLARGSTGTPNMEGNGFSSRKSSGVGSGQTELQVAESKYSDLVEQDMDVADNTPKAHLMRSDAVTMEESKRSNSARGRGNDSQDANITSERVAGNPLTSR